MLRIVLLATLISSSWASEPGVLRVQLTQRDGGKVADLSIERYVAAVLAGEASTFRSEQALQAMAVAVRTFGIHMKGRHAGQGFDVCGNTHCQLVDLKAVTPRFEQAAEATAGELLWFDGKPALACYSRDCGGRTEDASIVWQGPSIPYLKSKLDSYCRRQNSDWQWVADGRQLAAALKRSGLSVPAAVEGISVVKRTPSGRAYLLQVAGGGAMAPVSASAFRFAIGRELGWATMRSERWDVRGNGGQFLFQGSGSGHGAGLCQTGADEMGQLGKNYREILEYYYPGTKIGISGRGLQWSRLGGERVAVMTTVPNRDGWLVGLADRICRELGLWPTVEVRVYPDVDSFRNVTGEPGWVAGVADGRRIHLQPLRGEAVQSVLRHELLHVMVEDRAASNTPIWFREGLVAYLAVRHGVAPRAVAVSDTGIRQRNDAARARRAYDDAYNRVAALVQRHGEATVLNWLKQGLPPEVAQAAAPNRPASRT